jgi:hypothetical protein
MFLFSFTWVVILSRYRVVALTAPGVAAADPFQGEPAPAERAIA